MPRAKTFRETIQVGMDSQGKEIVMPEKTDWGFYCQAGIKSVLRTYRLEPDAIVEAFIKTVRQRKTRQTSNKPEKVQPAEPQEQERPQGKGVWQCDKGHKFDFPKKSVKDEDICPVCLTKKIELVGG